MLRDNPENKPVGCKHLYKNCYIVLSNKSGWSLEWEVLHWPVGKGVSFLIFPDNSRGCVFSRLRVLLRNQQGAAPLWRCTEKTGQHPVRRVFALTLYGGFTWWVWSFTRASLLSRSYDVKMWKTIHAFIHEHCLATRLWTGASVQRCFWLQFFQLPAWNWCFDRAPFVNRDQIASHVTNWKTFIFAGLIRWCHSTGSDRADDQCWGGVTPFHRLRAQTSVLLEPREAAAIFPGVLPQLLCDHSFIAACRHWTLIIKWWLLLLFLL